MNPKHYKFYLVAAILFCQSAVMAQSANILYVYGRAASTITQVSYDENDSSFVRTLEKAGHTVTVMTYQEFYSNGGNDQTAKNALIDAALSGKDLLIHGPGSINEKSMIAHILTNNIPAIALETNLALRYGIADNGRSNGSNDMWIDHTSNMNYSHPILNGITTPIGLATSAAVKTLRITDNHSPALEYVTAINTNDISKTIVVAPIGSTVFDSDDIFGINGSARISGDSILQTTIGFFSGVPNVQFNAALEDVFLATVNYIIPTSWNGASWSFGVPDANKTAIIAGTYTGAGFTCRALKVNETQTLTITSGSLDIKANTYNKGAIVIESGASLLNYANAQIYETLNNDLMIWRGNAATINRATRYADGKYSFVGSPVAADAGITGSNLGSIVYSYNEATAFSTDGLARWENVSTTMLAPGKGYAQAGKQNISFMGTPNAGDIVVAGTYNQDVSDNNEGWNLIANPYAAAINVTDFLAAHSTNLQPAVYIWDDNNSDIERGDNNDYIVANGSGVSTNSTAGNGNRYNNHIGSVQGFFVQLIDGQSTNITFSDYMKVAGNNSNDNFFRKETNNSLIRVNLTAENGFFKQTVIGFPENASDVEKNNLYDAPVFSNNADNALFTLKGEKALAIQGVSKHREAVAMLMNIAEAGTYTIEIEKEGTAANEVSLKDKLTGELISLENNAYTFTTTAGKAVDRFEVVFTASNILGAKTDVTQNLKVSVDASKQLTVFATNSAVRSYSIYNLMGAKVASFSSNRESRFDVSNIKSGVYILSDGTSAIKFLLK